MNVSFGLCSVHFFGLASRLVCCCADVLVLVCFFKLNPGVPHWTGAGAREGRPQLHSQLHACEQPVEAPRP